MAGAVHSPVGHPDTMCEKANGNACTADHIVSQICTQQKGQQRLQQMSMVAAMRNGYLLLRLCKCHALLV
jgi:hypothetical protein